MHGFHPIDAVPERVEVAYCGTAASVQRGLCGQLSESSKLDGAAVRTKSRDRPHLLNTVTP